MLILDIPSCEMFDEETDRFITVKEQTIKLEHSLLSVSKWESKWCKPFLDKNPKTKEETLDYVKCMIITPMKNYDVVSSFTSEQFNKISEYIDSPMTATTVKTFNDNKPPSREIITSELIYYWMVAHGIPFECEKWHINRLLTLIKVCNAKNQPEKKMSRVQTAKMQSALNAQRRAKLKSKG